MLNIDEFADGGELFDGRYKLLRTLSTDGGSADVWLAVDQNTVEEPEDGEAAEAVNAYQNETEENGILVAIKIYRPKNALDIEGERKFREEYKIVFNCHHANLLQPINFSIFKDTPYLVLPYCKKGSSELFIGQGLPVDELWKYIHDVASGLAYLHDNKPPIIHQDIKPANILIDDNNNYAITDFGISAQSGGKHEYYGDDNSGTFAYMAPERFADNPEPMAASDVWAFGATLYELITGRAPFGDEGGRVQLDGKVCLDYPAKGIPSAIKKMIAACLDKNPARRPSAEAIAEAARQHQFPATRSPLIKIALLAAAVVVAVGLIVVLTGRKEAVKPSPQLKPAVPTIEETFAANLHLLDCDDVDSLRRGLSVMDSLANHNYVPALNELFFTYGWYSDPRSLKRKKLLGIEVIERGWPKSDKMMDKAASYLNRIIENKKTDDRTKAYAKYRLAAYKARVSQGNYTRAKELLLESRAYAVSAGAQGLLDSIDLSLKALTIYK